MAKLVYLKEDTYENYLKKQKKSHFLQSYSWGELSKQKKNLTPYYLGLIDEKKNILGTALLLQKKLPMNYCYFYCPRGYVIDYENEELVKEMTKEIIKFAKSKKAIFVKIDPDLIYKDYNYLEEEQKPPYDINRIFNLLKKLGYKHQGFTKNFETMQPRYTFRIDLNQSIEDIENHFSKTTKQRITKAKKLNMTITKFIVSSCLKDKIVIVNGLDKVDSELRRIGNNINQLTRLANEKIITVIDLKELRMEVNNIWQLLKQLVQKQT